MDIRSRYLILSTNIMSNNISVNTRVLGEQPINLSGTPDVIIRMKYEEVMSDFVENGFAILAV